LVLSGCTKEIQINNFENLAPILLDNVSNISLDNGSLIEDNSTCLILHSPNDLDRIEICDNASIHFFTNNIETYVVNSTDTIFNNVVSGNGSGLFDVPFDPALANFSNIAGLGLNYNSSSKLNVEFKDNEILYFDTNKTHGVRYESGDNWLMIDAPVKFGAGAYKIVIDGNQIYKTNGSGYLPLMTQGAFPQIFLGSSGSTIAGFIDIDNNAPMYLNTLDNGAIITSQGGVFPEFDGNDLGNSTLRYDVTAKQLTTAGSNSCLMMRDTDNAGWTKCTTLNGVMSCSVDSDGIC
jgi:hypothetical protein